MSKKILQNASLLTWCKLHSSWQQLRKRTPAKIGRVALNSRQKFCGEETVHMEDKKQKKKDTLLD